MSGTKDNKQAGEPTVEELRTELIAKVREVEALEAQNVERENEIEGLKTENAEHLEINGELMGKISDHEVAAKAGLPVIKIGNRNHTIHAKKFKWNGTVYDAENFKGKEAQKIAAEMLKDGSEIFKPA